MASILQSDRVQINNRWAHCDGTNAGFLNTSSGWDMYVNNNGQIWTPNYGWLHDRFTQKGVGLENCAGQSANVGGYVVSLVRSGLNISVALANTNCNCNCSNF